MSIILVTGSAGLVGSETVRYYCRQGYDVFGIDNDMRRVFFGDEASTAWNRKKLEDTFTNYQHFGFDIREKEQVSGLLKAYGNEIELIVHTAAQPSHDWAAGDPGTDFRVNAVGTLNLLEGFRNHCPEAVFIFTSTNKVYGDKPNYLPLVEQDQRYELPTGHAWHRGIDETMSIDQTKHSLFGVSKVAADLLVQEYGQYFNLKTAVFRGGCLTGPAHSGTRLHGFLSYLMRCAITGNPYYIYGYQGKQVRDNIHSEDLVNAFDAFFKNPRVAEVYNIGGSRFANVSMLEAIDFCQQITGKHMKVEYVDENRIGDHMWWISDVSKFQAHYPEWRYQYGIERTLTDIFDAQKDIVS